MQIYDVCVLQPQREEGEKRKKKKLTKVAKRQQNLNGHSLRPSPILTRSILLPLVLWVILWILISSDLAGRL